MNNSENEVQLLPYSNKKKNSNNIKKYHILNSVNNIIKYKICNVFSPFGRETEYAKIKDLHQHRLNICFSKAHIKDDKSYKLLIDMINEIENYFKDMDELETYNLVSNIIDRGEYGIVIRFHLKTLNNRTITNLTQIIDGKEDKVEWIQFDKLKQYNMDFHPDCLWIDDTNKKFGISLAIESVIQFIS
jgi:hypothetical protein